MAGRAAAARPRRSTAADPYMTLVGYFSATRELAGMARYVGDDIQTALAKRRPWSRLPRRHGTDYGALQRRGAHVAGRQRGHHRDPGPDGRAVRRRAFDSAAGKRERRALREARQARARPRREPLRRGPGHLDAAGRGGRDPARTDARRRAAEEHRRVHPGVLPGRPGPRTSPAWWSRSGTGPGPGTWRTSSSSGTTTRRSTPRSRRCRSPRSRSRPWSEGWTGCWSARPGCCRPTDADGLSPEQGAGRIADQRDFARRADRRAGRPGDGAPRTRTAPSGHGSGWSTGSTSGPGGASTWRICARPWSTRRITDEAKYGPLMMSAENARAGGRRDGRAAVRGRQLHARGPAGDQPAGQPHARRTCLHRAARRADSGTSPRRGGS